MQFTVTRALAALGFVLLAATNVNAARLDAVARCRRPHYTDVDAGRAQYRARQRRRATRRRPGRRAAGQRRKKAQQSREGRRSRASSRARRMRCAAASRASAARSSPSTRPPTTASRFASRATRSTSSRRCPASIAVRPLQLMRPNNTQRHPADRRARRVAEPRRSAAKNIKIAVIDTGIDYTHANFGGPGTVGGVQRGARGRNRAGESRAVRPAAPRVKGGIDLVGDSYDADPNSATYQPVPHPDPNPLDCNGARLARRRHGGRLGRARERHDLHRSVQRDDRLGQQLDDRPRRRAEGRHLLGPRVRLRRLDRRHRRRDRMGGRQRHGRHQHVARLAVRHDRRSVRRRPRRTRRRPASSSSRRPATTARASTSSARRRPPTARSRPPRSIRTQSFPGAHRSTLAGRRDRCTAINANGVPVLGRR